MLPSRELFEHSIGINIRPFRRLFRIEGNFIAADFKIIFNPAVVVAENKAVVLFFVVPVEQSLMPLLYME